MSANPLLRLRELGQSVWLDYIQRDLIVNGGLAQVSASSSSRSSRQYFGLFDYSHAINRLYARSRRPHT